MKISFLGDICLARLIQAKYSKKKYQIVSQELIDLLNNSDYVIGNLESPICKYARSDGDHLSFRGAPEMLRPFEFIDYFSLSNNHINDCGTSGMTETMDNLESYNISHNGLYIDEYTPVLLSEKIAIITCTDMMNISFSKDCSWKILHIDDAYLDEIILEYKRRNYFIILYAHVGMLFSRYVNPPVRKLLHEKIKLGVDIIITVHAHCLGGMECYKGKAIFHSLGDFVMDGASYRRRQAAILNLRIENGTLKSCNVIPTIIDKELRTIPAPTKTKQKMLESWKCVSNNLNRHFDDYTAFFKFQYKRELFQHTFSTLKFIAATKGLSGMFRLIIKRNEEVFRMGKWLTSDRSNDRRDDEAILKDRKKFSLDELY